MSDDESEQEYEVESIVEAKVEKEKASRKAKNPKLIWKYRVRWKGYGPQDDTWEPAESFGGSENIVSTFWERANTNGRDVSDLSQFKLGEAFCHVGPPRPKRKRKSTTNVQEMTSQSAPQSTAPPPQAEADPGVKTSDKRRRDPSLNVEGQISSSRPSKRLRGEEPPSQPRKTEEVATKIDPTPSMATPTTRKSARNRRPPSPEVIPDSDEEMNGSSLLNILSPGYKRRTTVAVGHENQSSRRIEASIGPESVQGVVSEPQEEPASKVPAHRARATNPRVKMIEDPNISQVDGALSPKARATRGAARATSSHAAIVSVSSKRSKPGPGRSSAGLLVPKTTSLLTAENGSLKTVKVKNVNSDSHPRPRAEEASPIIIDDDMPEVGVINEPPPSGGELLQLAGLDSQVAETLPDFEDMIPEPQQQSGTESSPDKKEQSAGDQDIPSHNFSVDMPKHNLFPAQAPNFPEPLSVKWKQSTIFGPLSLGAPSIVQADKTNSSRLYLNLDASVSIPVLVHAASPDSNRSNFEVVANGTPGKFYSTQAATNLLGTVRMAGVPARIVVDNDTSSEEKEHLRRFHQRLTGGDIFVSIAGTQILVFCASGNTLLSQRLNAPSSLLSEPDAILVAPVVIENFSGYADAASAADDTQWTQYIKSHP
ncbi:unnamed protein product [Cyclocybe aegerita]|uniref:Chromo domain-containing protein n=1 Tax=Cyclocybe aegerita TaxID=1973307 RepID=A0A8S0VV95_CYCAE|nr:unnamed protein product [Cyclocybe aegerita]